jgi:hypothetical protein
MFRQRFVFNIIGEKANVDKASVEIKQIISNLTREPVDIIMEDKSSILRKITQPWSINKCYLPNGGDTELQSSKLVELSRHIRNSSRDTIHPWNLHVENVESKYVSDFMKTCSQVNCVYPLNALGNEKKGILEMYIPHSYQQNV